VTRPHPAEPYLVKQWKKLWTADIAGQLLYTKQSGGPSAAKNTRYIYLNRHLIAEVSQ